jgi:hypothetical protein
MLDCAGGVPDWTEYSWPAGWTKSTKVEERAKEVSTARVDAGTAMPYEWHIGRASAEPDWGERGACSFAR